MMKHIALLLLFSLFWGLPAIGQETGSRKVTGYIVDSSGNPIAGATVKIKDTTTATISDGNGQFSLTVQNSESTLIATFLGYRTHEVKITPTTDNIKITLEEDAQQLDDVVVVGYGTQKKSSLTSSVEVVRGEDLKRMPVMNVNEALVGLVAGVSVQNSSGDPSSGKESDIRIRGINGTPLLVIDGVPRFGENTSDGEMPCLRHFTASTSTMYCGYLVSNVV